MRHLDDELRNALRRAEAPAGFADRVIERAAREERTARPSMRPFMRWAAAAMIVGALAGADQYRAVQDAREERLRGEAAKEQVIQALRITGSKLHLVQVKIKEIGS
jgi:hypothetical protein